MGSQTDIQKATGLATTIIKDCGLGKITASIKSKSANTIIICTMIQSMRRSKNY